MVALALENWKFSYLLKVPYINSFVESSPGSFTALYNTEAGIPWRTNHIPTTIFSFFKNYRGHSFTGSIGGA